MHIPLARTIAVAAAAAAVFAVAASARTSGPLASGRNAATGLAYAKQQIKAYEQVPKFAFKGPAFKPKVTGKKILDIPLSSTIPTLGQADRAMQAIAKRFKINFQVFPNQGQPSQWQQGVQQATTTHANGILLDAAPDPMVLQPQLAAAKKQGIKIVVSHLWNVGEKLPPNTDAIVPADFSGAGRLMADWTIVDTKGHANVLIFGPKEVPPTAYIVAAMQAEYKKYCPGCTAQYINVPLTQFATNLQNDVTNAIKSNPQANYVVPVYDNMVQWAAPGVVASGKQNSVHIATYNGTDFVLKMIKQQHVVRMDVGENWTWLGWANMDQMMRVLSGVRPVPNEHTALRVWDASNIAQDGNPPNGIKGYGNAYVKGYNRIWRGR